MEINSFFFKEKTKNLSAKFLEHIQENLEQFNSLLLSLKNSFEEPKRVAISAELFQLAHRLKGSGGTYGLQEISILFYRKLTILRSAYNDQRALTKEDIKITKENLKITFEYYPILQKAYNCLYWQDPAKPSPGFLLINLDRTPIQLFLEEELIIKNKTLYHSSQITPCSFLFENKAIKKTLLEVSSIMNFHKDQIMLFENLLQKENSLALTGREKQRISSLPSLFLNKSIPYFNENNKKQALDWCLN